jgi:hypothetical protein
MLQEVALTIATTPPAVVHQMIDRLLWRLASSARYQVPCTLMSLDQIPRCTRNYHHTSV